MRYKTLGQIVKKADGCGGWERSIRRVASRADESERSTHPTSLPFTGESTTPAHPSSTPLTLTLTTHPRTRDPNTSPSRHPKAISVTRLYITIKHCHPNSMYPESFIELVHVTKKYRFGCWIISATDINNYSRHQRQLAPYQIHINIIMYYVLVNAIINVNIKKIFNFEHNNSWCILWLWKVI